jgi:hypothetical protein
MTALVDQQNGLVCWGGVYTAVQVPPKTIALTVAVYDALTPPLGPATTIYLAVPASCSVLHWTVLGATGLNATVSVLASPTGPALVQVGGKRGR